MGFSCVFRLGSEANGRLCIVVVNPLVGRPGPETTFSDTIHNAHRGSAVNDNRQMGGGGDNHAVAPARDTDNSAMSHVTSVSPATVTCTPAAHARWLAADGEMRSAMAAS